MAEGRKLLATVPDRGSLTRLSGDGTDGQTDVYQDDRGRIFTHDAFGQWWAEPDQSFLAHREKAFPSQLDITAPEKGVQVEYDQHRAVLYVHVDGYTALRICRIPGPVEFVGVTLAPSSLGEALNSGDGTYKP